MSDETPEPPTNVRVVDTATSVEVPVDTVFDHVSDDGVTMFRIVNFPEWYHPARHRIEIDAIPPLTGLIAPLPRGAMPPGMKKIEDTFNAMSDELMYAGLSAYLSRVVTLVFLAYLAVCWMWFRPNVETLSLNGSYVLLFAFILTHARMMQGMSALYRRLTGGRTD